MLLIFDVGLSFALVSQSYCTQQVFYFQEVSEGALPNSIVRMYFLIKFKIAFIIVVLKLDEVMGFEPIAVLTIPRFYGF